MANKWFYFKQTMRQAVFNLFCDDKNLRQWLMSEEDHEHYKQLFIDYRKIEAERDMWYNVAQVSNQKLQYMIEWVNANWSKNNEKQRI